MPARNRFVALEFIIGFAVGLLLLQITRSFLLLVALAVVYVALRVALQTRFNR